MKLKDWLDRWREGNIGWHQNEGNKGLQQYWPKLPNSSRVLVPLCGKTVDMAWLNRKGMDVTGVEISATAAKTFFEEQGLEYECLDKDSFTIYRAKSTALTIYCGNYFEFVSSPFDALYDRASLIALGSTLRPHYIRHTKSLLKHNAKKLVITLEYDQRKVDGPPFSVTSHEVNSYWPRLSRIKEAEALDTCPPKFKASGITSVTEVLWLDRE